MTDSTVRPETWSDFDKECGLTTGKGAAINYEFVGMEIQVPRDLGPEAPRATWSLTARCGSPPATSTGSG